MRWTVAKEPAMTALVFDKQCKVAGVWYKPGERASLGDGLAAVLVDRGLAHRPGGVKADRRMAVARPRPAPAPPAKHR
jgi:hypothetical protein